MMILEFIFWCLMGGFAYRVRGGLLDKPIGKLLGKPPEWEISNGLIRAVWALTVAACLVSYGYDPVICALMAIPLFIGVTFDYFGGKFDLMLASNRTFYNYFLLTTRGMAIILPAAVTATALFLMHISGFKLAASLWAGVIAGTLFVPSSLSGNFIYTRISKLQAWTQWGEWFLGAAILGTIFLAIS